MQIEQLLEHLNVVVLHDLAHLTEVRENVSICLRVWREEKRRKWICALTESMRQNKDRGRSYLVEVLQLAVAIG